MHKVANESKNRDIEFYALLDDFLKRDVTISARSISRSHSNLKAASSITRHKARLQALNEFKAKQEELRGWRGKIDKTSKLSIAENLSIKDQKIEELEHQVQILTESHLQMIRAIGKIGGFSKWVDFFDSYDSIKDELTKLGATPPQEFPMILPHPTTKRHPRKPIR